MFDSALSIETTVRPLRCAFSVRTAEEFRRAACLGTHLWGGNAHPILPSPRGRRQEAEFRRAIVALNPDVVVTLDRGMTKRERRAVDGLARKVGSLPSERIDRHLSGDEFLRFDIGILPHPFLALSAKHPTPLKKSAVRLVSEAADVSMPLAALSGVPSKVYSEYLKTHFSAVELRVPATAQDWVKFSAIGTTFQFLPDVGQVGLSRGVSWKLSGTANPIDKPILQSAQSVVVFLLSEDHVSASCALWNFRGGVSRDNVVCLPERLFQSGVAASLETLFQGAQPKQLVFVVSASRGDARDLLHKVNEFIAERGIICNLAVIHDGFSYSFVESRFRAAATRKLRLRPDRDHRVAVSVDPPDGMDRKDVVFAVDMKIQSEYGERLRLPTLKSVALALANTSTAIKNFRQNVGGGGRLWLRDPNWIRPAKEGVSGSALASREFEFYLHDEDFFVEQALQSLPLNFTAHQHNRFARGFVRRAGGMRAALTLVRQNALSILSVLAFDRSEQPGLLVDQIVGFMVRDHKFEASDAQEKVRELLPELLRRELIARGIGQTCPECEMADWYPIEGLREVLQCAGCLDEFQLEGRGPQYRIRINELARRFLRGSGGRAVLECASTLKRIDPSVAISFGANVARDNGDAAEIDIIALTPDGLLFGECKSFFDPSAEDLMTLDQSVRSLLAISAEAGVSEAVVGVACSRGEDRVLQAVQAHRAWANEQGVHLDLVLNEQLFIGTNDRVDPARANYYGLPPIKPRNRCIIGNMLASFGFGAREPMFHTDVMESWSAELLR